MDATEKEIIEQLKQGDEKAYRYLFDNHYVTLCQVANSFLKDSFLAETIVGDIIFHLWEKRDTLDIQLSLRAYLVRSVRNRCLNYLNQSYVVREMRIDTSPGSVNPYDFHTQIEDQPTASLLEKELEGEINKAISRLPKECRTVFEMSRFEELKYQEIADKLNISINTVKYHIKNALSSLNKDLSKYLTLFFLILKAYL